MIFVSMDADGLIRRTSQYHLRSSSLANQTLSGASSPPRARQEYRPVSRRRHSASREVPPPISDQVARATARPAAWVTESFVANTALTFRDFNDRVPERSLPQAVGGGAYHNFSRMDQAFGVTTHCDQPSDDEEEESSPQTLADRYHREFSHRERMPSSFSLTSDEDADDALNPAVISRRLGMSPSRIRSSGRARRRESPSRIEVAPAREEEAVGSSILAPHARFFIESEKSTVSVSFDPPV